jgi:hypothetical protein
MGKEEIFIALFFIALLFLTTYGFLYNLKIILQNKKKEV